MIKPETPIEDPIYHKNLKFNIRHPLRGLKMKWVYNYAMKQTLKELHQAVEGMYHNLNTLQSRSGNQLNKGGWLVSNY